MVINYICNGLCVCCWPRSTTIYLISHLCQFICYPVGNVGSKTKTMLWKLMNAESISLLIEESKHALTNNCITYATTPMVFLWVKFSNKSCQLKTDNDINTLEWPTQSPDMWNIIQTCGWLLKFNEVIKDIRTKEDLILAGIWDLTTSVFCVHVHSESFQVNSKENQTSNCTKMYITKYWKLGVSTACSCIS